MFKIIGADQKEYGPISVGQIRQWIRDGRLNAQTPAQREGGTDWQQLSTFAEFADLFQTAAPAGPGGPAPTYAPAAMPGPIPTASREAALSAVKGPAIALIIVASLGIGLFLLSAIAHLLHMGGPNPYRNMNDVPPLLQQWITYSQGPLGALGDLLAAGINVFILLGAIKMMRLEGRTFAFIACILAMLPCTCCCVGLPFGIWGLVMLNKPDVKSQFTN